MTKEQAQAMSQYDSTNFPPQAEPEPRGLLAKLMYGNATLLKHNNPCEQLSSAMLLHATPSHYHRAKDSKNAGEDFNDKAITVRGCGVWASLHVYFASLAKVAVLYVAPLSFAVIVFSYFYLGGEIGDYVDVGILYSKITLVIAFIWFPVELHAKEKIKLPWLKEQKIFALSRETGLVTLYKSRGRVRFSHPFIEFDCYLSSHPAHQGFLHYRLMLVHRYGGYKHGIPMTIFTHDTASCIEYLRVWATIQQYMDISQPLPDLLMFEPWRERDATTRAYDKARKRPKNYWTSMSDSEFEEVVKTLLAKQNSRGIDMRVLDIYQKQDAQ